MSDEIIPFLPPSPIDSSNPLPAIFQAVPDSGRRFLEFFTVNIRNPNTRKAYFRPVASFAAWCEERGLHDLGRIAPMHVAAYIEQLGRTMRNPPSSSTSRPCGCFSIGSSLAR